MCFGGCNETSQVSSSMEACENATNAYLRLKYKKRSSWLFNKVHRIKKMVKPVIEILHKTHRAEKYSEDRTSPNDFSNWDSGAEEMENDANEALESKFPECRCSFPICYEMQDSCHQTCFPVFIPLAWAADADICLRESGIVITSSQKAEQQSPYFAI